MLCPAAVTAVAKAKDGMGLLNPATTTFNKLNGVDKFFVEDLIIIEKDAGLQGCHPSQSDEPSVFSVAIQVSETSLQRFHSSQASHRLCQIDTLLYFGVPTLLCFVRCGVPSVSVITVTFKVIKTLARLRLVRSPMGPCWIEPALTVRISEPVFNAISSALIRLIVLVTAVVSLFTVPHLSCNEPRNKRLPTEYYLVLYVERTLWGSLLPLFAVRIREPGFNAISSALIRLIVLVTAAVSLSIVCFNLLRHEQRPTGTRMSHIF
jgi:hypothetical protein